MPYDPRIDLERRSVLSLTLQGRSPNEIAALTGIPKPTIYGWRQGLKDKLLVRARDAFAAVQAAHPGDPNITAFIENIQRVRLIEPRLARILPPQPPGER